MVSVLPSFFPEFNFEQNQTEKKTIKLFPPRYNTFLEVNKNEVIDKSIMTNFKNNKQS